MGKKADSPQVGIVMGSRNDHEIMKETCALLKEFGIPYEARVLSAHRTPKEVSEWATSAESRGLKVIVAAAGGAAHLAGVVAAHTLLPVLGVPIASTPLGGLDSLLSIAQMPKCVPVGTLAVGKPGAANAAILAAEILALTDSGLRERLEAWRKARREEVLRQELE